MIVEELIEKLKALNAPKATVLADPKGPAAIHITDVEKEEDRVYIIVR